MDKNKKECVAEGILNALYEMVRKKFNIKIKLFFTVQPLYIINN